jgi:hypothetical protein
MRKQTSTYLYRLRLLLAYEREAYIALSRREWRNYERWLAGFCRTRRRMRTF